MSAARYGATSFRNMKKTPGKAWSSLLVIEHLLQYTICPKDEPCDQWLNSVLPSVSMLVRYAMNELLELCLECVREGQTEIRETCDHHPET